MEMVYDISPEGAVRGLHHDSFSLGFLGAQRIGRASEIFFDEEAQSWFVVLTGAIQPADCATGFVSYDAARRFEAAWLTECQKEQVTPESEEGLRIGMDLRNNL